MKGEFRIFLCPINKMGGEFITQPEARNEKKYCNKLVDHFIFPSNLIRGKQKKTTPCFLI
jgi:hypothetical protein